MNAPYNSSTPLLAPLGVLRKPAFGRMPLKRTYPPPMRVRVPPDIPDEGVVVDTKAGLGRIRGIFAFRFPGDHQGFAGRETLPR